MSAACVTQKRPDASSCDPLINTTVTFADRPASRRAAAQTDTQVALAQLYAHVSAMPESGRKRKLLKQVSRSAGGDAHLRQAEPPSGSGPLH